MILIAFVFISIMFFIAGAEYGATSAESQFCDECQAHCLDNEPRRKSAAGGGRGK